MLRKKKKKKKKNFGICAQLLDQPSQWQTSQHAGPGSVPKFTSTPITVKQLLIKNKNIDQSKSSLLIWHYVSYLFLFLLYINGLPGNVQSQARLFAEDTVVYLTINHPSDASLLQKDLDQLQRWEVKWNMEFNPSKCQVLHITKARAPIKTSYTMHNQTLDSVSAARYLGVDLSTNMNFNTHINRITSNANKSLGFIKRNIKTKHPGVREAAYKTIVRP